MWRLHKILHVLYKTHEHPQVISITGSWNYSAKAWRVKGVQFTLFSWVAELGLGSNTWTQVPVCLVTGLGCISCVTLLLYRMGTTMGIHRREEHFYLRGRAWRTQRCPKEVARKLNKRARIQPGRWVGQWCPEKKEQCEQSGGSNRKKEGIETKRAVLCFGDSEANNGMTVGNRWEENGSQDQNQVSHIQEGRSWKVAHGKGAERHLLCHFPPFLPLPLLQGIYLLVIHLT